MGDGDPNVPGDSFFAAVDRQAELGRAQAAHEYIELVPAPVDLSQQVLSAGDVQVVEGRHGLSIAAQRLTKLMSG